MKNFLPRVLNVLFCLCLCLPFPCCATTADVTTQKAVYLTFDDGPTDSTTPKVLSVLKEKGVCATCFVVGRQISTRTEILKSIAESGNAIGIHTQTHDYRSIYASAESLEKDILECKKSIAEVLPDYEVKTYRFPGGSSTVSEALKKVPEKCGLRFFDWNAETGDAFRRTAAPATLFHGAVETGCDRDLIVLLMHDGVNYKSTVAALPMIIDYYKERDYAFLTLEELL